jgi:hypothetical protein
MALKHDAQGFLVGDPIDIGRALAVWDDIRNDVRAIRKAVLGVGESPSSPGHDTAKVGRPTGRRGTGMEEADPAVKARRSTQDAALLRPAATPERGAAKKQGGEIPASLKVPAKPAVTPNGRDGRGRFVAGKPADAGGNDRAEPEGEKSESALRGVADRIVSAVNGAGAGMEEADPAVKAFQEVAQPMARGYEFMTGGSDDKKQVGFLRRIFGTLNAFRKEEGVFNKAANRSLKNLEAKPEGGEGGNGGFWGTILSAIMGIGPAILAGIGALLSKIPFFGPKIGGAGAGGVGAGAAGAAGGTAKAGGGFFKGALKKIPLLGALLAVGGAAADIYGSENDDKLSRREKDKNAGKAVGGAGGTIAGMAAGAAAGAFAGPVGMAIGGMVGAFLGDQAGQIIGDTVGGWVNDLRNADIVGTITGAWDSVTSTVKSGWDGVVSGFTAVSETIGKGWDAIKGGFDNLVSGIGAIWDNFSGFLKEKFGIDIPGILKPVVDAGKKVVGVVVDTASAAKQKAVEVGTKAVEKGKEVAQATKEKAVEVGTKAVEGVKQGAEYLGNNTTIGKGVKAAGDWVLGQTSKLFESGKGGAATVSSGKGDYGGASYGTYQLSSKMGEVQNFLKGSKYGDQFAGLQPGTPEFNAKWKEVAKVDPEFGGAQHDYIKATKFDPAMAGLKKSGIDLSKDGAAVQDAIWSTSVQFGAGGAQKLVKNAFKDKDVSKMTEAEKISAIQDYKIANNDKLFSKSDDNVRAGTAKRAVEEKKRLLALADQDASANAGVKDAMGGGTQTAQAGQVTYPPKAAVEVATASIPKPPALVATASLTNVQTAHLTMPPAVSPPSVQTFNDAPPVVDTLASNSGSANKKPAAATVAAPDAGQDLRDRRIAHIVTGGLSSA